MLTELIRLCADFGEIGNFRRLIRRNYTLRSSRRPTVVRRLLTVWRVYPFGKISRPRQRGSQ